MKDSTTFTKNLRTKKKEAPDDSVLSKNHSKSVRYRLRVQQEREAEQIIKDYKDDPDGANEFN